MMIYFFFQIHSIGELRVFLNGMCCLKEPVPKERGQVQVTWRLLHSVATS